MNVKSHGLLLPGLRISYYYKFYIIQILLRFHIYVASQFLIIHEITHMQIQSNRTKIFNLRNCV